MLLLVGHKYHYSAREHRCQHTYSQKTVGQSTVGEKAVGPGGWTQLNNT